MARTVIEKGRLLRRTKPIPPRRAASFKRALERNPHQRAFDVQVIPTGTDRAEVQFAPAPRQHSALIERLQAMRRDRAETGVRSYEWRRVAKRAWKCTSHEGNVYVIVLPDEGAQGRADRVRVGCSCPDWGRVSEVGLKCKHYLCALQAEQNYQEHLRRVELERKAA